ncbi:hypothetical protein DFH08DRAFT_1078066 [Mycena albidolilacea]|uniref:Uncharacterized protein n=1 Tax=Mycena albidolilacea TaxID=1033008 RepID=A0AAD7AA25_9AGAR|nr:hypothetical protein DFH08DRAFT_1078066 [Mycena albidolilacea]
MFLKAHPCLEHLAFFGSLCGYSDGISSLQLMPLPQPQAFTGEMNQLKEISTTHLSSLQSLRLSDCFSPEAEFAPILKPFPSVTSLAVCVHFEWPLNGDEGFFSHLLSSCPQLTHVEISSTSAFRLDDFCDAIRRTPHLRTFILTLPRRTKQFQSMAAFALRWEFTIRDVADWKHEDQLNDNYRLSVLGVYHIVKSGPDRLLLTHEIRWGSRGPQTHSARRVIPFPEPEYFN